MKKVLSNTVDSVILTINTLWSLENIQTILGVILLILQILWILSKIIVKVHSKIKNKRYDEIPDTFKEGIDELDDLIDKLEGDKNE